VHQGVAIPTTSARLRARSVETIDLDSNELTTLQSEINLFQALEVPFRSSNVFVSFPEEMAALMIFKGLDLSKSNLTALPSGFR